MQAATGWLIQDNYIHAINGNGVSGQGGSAGIELDYNTVNTYNVIRSNTFQDMGIYNGSAGNWPVNILVRGNYNLVEYNTIGKGNDRVNVFGSHNIVRNNSFTPMLESDLGTTSDPHIDDFQSFYPTDLPLVTFLFERNFGDRNDTANAHQMIIRDTSGVGGLKHVINRFNVSSQNGSIFELFESADVLRTYNNTISNAQSAQTDPCYYAAIVDPNSSAPDGMAGSWYNNSFTNSVNNGSTQDVIFNNSGGYFTVTEDYNHVYPKGKVAGAHSVAGRDPLFNNASGLDFTLQPNSPLHNAGGPLTKAVSAGYSSTTLVVADAAGFCDGWGIADGDINQVGTNAFVQLATGAINYATNTITLPIALTWNSGDPVSVKGMADIGALPFNYATGFLVVNTTATIVPAGSASLTATVTNGDAVRKVEFLVDGVPVGVAYGAPYSVNWTAGGNLHVVEARAYSAWASKTLYLSSFSTIAVTEVALAPDITSAASATATKGSAFSFTVTASNSPTNYAAAGLPPGLAINASSGIISGTPTVAGTSTVTVSATNATGTGSATLTITVNAALSAPVISSTKTATATKGITFSYTITASNSPTSYAATGLPAGLAINTSSGVISGTPTAAGTSSVTISATNATGTGSTTLTITVNAALSVPAITSARTATATKGSAFSYTIAASNSPTGYAATGLPAGLAINTSSGVISGTPSVAGTYGVTISATNAAGTESVTLTITVNASLSLPLITGFMADTATVGSWFYYAIAANNSPTSYAATGLPAGLAINSSTGIINGTPSIVGTYGVTISATNAKGTSSATLTITVNAAPLAPVISSAKTATATKGTTFSYTITASNSPTSYAAAGLPTGLTVNTSTGAIYGTPSVTGTSSVTISATNATGTGSATLTITVSTVLSAPVISSANSATATTGNWFSYTITASNSPTNFGATGLPAGLTVNVSTGVISGTSTVAGTSSVTISATNAAGTGTATLTLTIKLIGAGLAAPALAPPVTASRLINLSIRSNVGSGNNSLITGFVVSGASKTLLVRAIGPSLEQFGVSGFLPDPDLAIFSGTTEILSDTSWGGSADLAKAFTQVGAFALLPTSNDSALLATFTPGPFTAQISGSGGASGVALAEIYDADPLDSPSRLINVSTLAHVGNGADILIAGFVIGGSTTETVLIRGIGPTLTSFGVSGVLANPQLTLSDSNGAVIANNSGWGGSTTLANVFEQVGAFSLPVGSNDAALVMTLSPGSYTVSVSGADQTTGTALVEIYEVP